MEWKCRIDSSLNIRLFEYPSGIISIYAGNILMKSDRIPLPIDESEIIIETSERCESLSITNFFNHQKIDLSGVKTGKIEVTNGIFKKLILPSSADVTVSNCGIQSLDDIFFPDPKRIYRLNLSENDLEECNVSEFSNLSELYVHHNLLRKFPILPQNPRIEILNLSDNPFNEEIEEGVLNIDLPLKDLRELKLVGMSKQVSEIRVNIPSADVDRVTIGGKGLKKIVIPSSVHVSHLEISDSPMLEDLAASKYTCTELDIRHCVNMRIVKAPKCVKKLSIVDSQRLELIKIPPSAELDVLSLCYVNFSPSFFFPKVKKIELLQIIDAKNLRFVMDNMPYVKTLQIDGATSLEGENLPIYIPFEKFGNLKNVKITGGASVSMSNLIESLDTISELESFEGNIYQKKYTPDFSAVEEEISRCNSAAWINNYIVSIMMSMFSITIHPNEAGEERILLVLRNVYNYPITPKLIKFIDLIPDKTEKIVKAKEKVKSDITKLRDVIM